MTPGTAKPNLLTRVISFSASGLGFRIGVLENLKHQLNKEMTRKERGKRFSQVEPPNRTFAGAARRGVYLPAVVYSYSIKNTQP